MQKVASDTTETGDTSENSFDYYGYREHPENKEREYDKDFEGPVKSRSCTDIICLALFIIAIVFEAIICGFAFIKGDPKYLIKPTDYEGNICGEGIHVNRSYLLYFDVMQCAKYGVVGAFTNCPSPHICVEQCPDKDWIFTTLAIDEDINGRSADKREEQLICTYEYNKRILNFSIPQIVSGGLCAPYYVDSAPLTGRCLPKFLVNATQNFPSILNVTRNTELLKQPFKILGLNSHTSVLKHAGSIWKHVLLVGEELTRVWPWFIYMFILASFLAVVYTLVVSHFTFVMVFSTMISTFIAFIILLSFALYRYLDVEKQPSSIKSLNFAGMEYYYEEAKLWLALLIFSAVGVGINFIIICVIRNRIHLAVKILKEAGKCLRSMWLSFFYPVIPAILSAAVVVGWGVVTVYLFSVMKRRISPMSFPLLNITSQAFESAVNCAGRDDADCKFVAYTQEYYAYILQLYHLFMAFWLFVFVNGLCDMVLSGAFCTWYWTWDKHANLPHFPITGSFVRTVTYHVGTVAFGSLTIAIVMFIRFLLMLLYRKLKGKHNILARFFVCILMCCFWCVEKILRFITKNAFIITAMLGKSFCPAAANSFFLITRNVLRFIVVDNVSSFVLFLGKMFIIALIATASYFFTRPSYHYFYVHIFIAVVIAYVVVGIFFEVMEAAIDTLFLCVMEDLERNDGSPGKPYFMSKGLMKALGKKNHKKPHHQQEQSCCGCC